MSCPCILFIAPSSYPIYGAEANVNAKVIKMLCSSGCTLDLVCRSQRNRPNNYPLTESDFYFGKLRSIHSVEVNTQKNISTIWRNVLTFLKTGYVYWPCEWALGAIEVCEKLIAQNNYDYIYTYDAPSELVGCYLSRKYNLKWVATWNDPYVWNKYPAPYGGGAKSRVDFLRMKLIKDIGKYTFKNVFPSDRLRDYMLKYMVGMKAESCVISPHILLEELELENKTTNSELTIIHAGALGRERDPKTLLQGLSAFVDKNPQAKIKFIFLGVFERIKGDYFSDMIVEQGLESYVECIAPVPYSESLEIVSKYDVCLLVEANCEEGIFLPSKIADYMQNNKPIFAVSPRLGVINDMYRKGEIDYFADVENAAEIADEIEKIYNDFVAERLNRNNKILSFYRSKSVIEISKKLIWQ